MEPLPLKDLRDYTTLLKERDWMEEFSDLLSTKYEIPHLMKRHDGEKAVSFTNVKEYEMKVYGNLCCRRDFMAGGLGVDPKQILERIIHALETPIQPRVLGSGPCQEVEISDIDLLRELPVLTHYEHDAGPYITSGIVITKEPETGRVNASYHRMMVVGRRRLVARLVEGRHLHRFYSSSKSLGRELEAAVVIGAPLELLIAASSSPGEMCELEVAGGLIGTPMELVACRSVGVDVPRHAEIVLEGRFLLESVEEGPFVDITGTYDRVREQPVFEVDTMTRRGDAFYHALLPGGRDHLLLMGMPKEAKALGLVRSVSRVKDIVLTEAGSNWLDAVISIKKTHPHEPYLTAMAAITAHPSLKRVTIVDEDVDIHDPVAVEKAVVERAYVVDDYFVIKNVRGSSLDHSGIRPDGTRLPPAKLIIDATIKGERMLFETAKIPQPRE
ncbi:MAG: UbiD family decarboxylase [Candidatus Bathyarchaeia archaeon]